MTPEEIDLCITLLEQVTSICEELARVAEKYPVITESDKFRQLCNPEQLKRIDAIDTRINALPG